MLRGVVCSDNDATSIQKGETDGRKKNADSAELHGICNFEGG